MTTSRTPGEQETVEQWTVTASDELVVVGGPLSGSRFELTGREMVVGRDAGCDVCLEGDADVSRRHARLRAGEGGWELEDLGSLNGTVVDGRRLEAATRLERGAQFTVGSTTLALGAPAPDDTREQELATDHTREQELATDHKREQELATETADPAAAMAEGKRALAEDRNEDALTAFQKAIAAQPQRAGGHYGAGVALLMLERRDEARAAFLAALERDPGHAQAVYHLGLMAEERGDRAEAIDRYEAALAIDAEHAEARRRLERLRRKVDKRAEEEGRGRAARGAAAEGAAAEGRRTLADELDAPAADGSDGTRGELLLDARRRVSSFGGRWLTVALLVGAALASESVLTSARRQLREADAAGTRDAVRALRDLQDALPMVFLGLALLVLAWILLASSLTRFRVYERRIDFQTGVLNRRQSTLWLYDVTDVDVERTPMLILAGTSAIALQSEARKVARRKRDDDGSVERIVGVASARRSEELADQIRKRVLQERRKMKDRFI